MDRPHWTLVLHTWPYQWIYWPAYRALDMLRERIAHDRLEMRLEIELKVHRGGDTAIFEAFKNCHATKAPYQLHGMLSAPPNGHDHKFQIRRFPVLWRLPHWLLIPKCRDKETPGYIRSYADIQRYYGQPGQKIVSFPQGSTSGIWARRLFDLAEHAEFNDDLYQKPGSDPIFTFIPLHAVYPDDYQVHAQLRGDTKDVTTFSFAVVDDEGEESEQRERIEAALRHCLQEELNNLSRTEGLEGEVEDLVKRAESANGFAAGTRGFGDDGRKYDQAKLSYLLAVFVRQACYVPYRALDQAIGDSIEALAQESIRGLASDIRQRFRSHFRGTREWSDLSFKERLAAQCSYRPPSSEKMLWGHLMHPTTASRDSGLNWRANARTSADRVERAKMTIDHVIETTSVNPGPGHTALATFQSSSTYHCGRDPQKCRKGRGDCDKPCFVCTASGLLAPIARMAKSLIEQELRLHYENCQVEELVDDQDFMGSLVTWGDVKDFVETFCSEIRGPEDYKLPPRCAVALFGEANADDAYDYLDRVTFAILWQGNVAERTGIHKRRTGGARERLAAWAKQHQHENRRVEAQLWRGQEWIGNCSSPSDLLNKNWEAQRVRFYTERGWTPTLAYVAHLSIAKTEKGI